MPRATARRTFHTLDGLRGVAAGTVLIYHFPSLWSPASAPSAYLAVDLFFLMSGFVIEHAYGQRLATGLGVRRFLLLRLIRLYPLYLVGTGITALAIAGAMLAHQPAVQWTVPMLVGSILCSRSATADPARAAHRQPLSVECPCLVAFLRASG